jgi:D-sedoheptulose 7-phosphate isomerase
MVFFIGNGGSAGIAMHMTVDFLKNGGMRTHGMHDPAVLTCLANDFGYEHVFSKQLEIVAGRGDLLVAISSSGESENIINAVLVAHEKDCKVLTLSGFQPDNRLRQLGDYNIYVPSMEYGIVESIHNLLLQQIVDEMMLRDKKGETK